MYVTLLLVEILLLPTVGTPFVVMFIRHMREGVQIQQLRVWKSGQTLSAIGVVVLLVLPKAMGIEYNTSAVAERTLDVVVAIGLTVLFVGFYLSLTAYKTEGKTPIWTRKLSNIWN